MNVTLCSVPVEPSGTIPKRKRSEGQMGTDPRMAITSLNYWATKNGFQACKFYDIDMLYPTDEEVEKYYIYLKNLFLQR